jgi:hypothetical protein
MSETGKPGRRGGRGGKRKDKEEKAVPENRKLTLRLPEEKRNRYRAFAAAMGKTVTGAFVEAIETSIASQRWYMVQRSSGAPHLAPGTIPPPAGDDGLDRRAG